MQKLDHCPVCGSGELATSAPIQDHMVSKEFFTLSTCHRCSHKFTNPRVLESEIGPYYDSPDYISHTNSNSGLFAQVYQRLRNINLGRKYRLVSRYAPSEKSLLDIGCGTGAFLHYLTTKGFSVQGVEINNGARQLASQWGQVFERVEEFSDPFDLITMWHVLEHIYDLNAFFRNLPLKKNGVLFVAVPNHQSYDANQYGEHWAAWDVPIHIHHFSQESIAAMADIHGFTLEQTVPMTLDSYYVSLLSEQFKRGGEKRALSDWFNAFSTGWKSNRRARTSSQYSSLIYVLRKKN